jgi:hypothetical protein
LHRWETHLKAQKAAASPAVVQKETDKKANRAVKIANRELRKAEEQKLKHANGHATSFAPKQNIQQPDKNKKSR